MSSILDVFRSPVDLAQMQKNYVEGFDKQADLQYKQAQEYARTRPPHQAVSACTKCGNNERHPTKYKVHDYMSSRGDTFTDEWLARECKGCGFKWNEAIVTN